jgi:uncharacterized protein
MGVPPVAELPDFQRRQYGLAAHLRDPEKVPPPPGMETRRLALYRELLYNNVEGFLQKAFPVLRRITRDDRWHAMAHDFFARHRSRSPLFREIALEFLTYLEQERGVVADDPPFLRELAHYEWVEQELFFSDVDRTLPVADPDGDLSAGVPVPSPLARVLSYRYPVHRIGPEFQPSAPPASPTHLVVYRDRQDRMGFLEINPITRRLLELLQEGTGGTGLQILEQIAAELAHPRPEVVLTGGRELLAELRDRDILLGTRPPGCAAQERAARASTSISPDRV